MPPPQHSLPPNAAAILTDPSNYWISVIHVGRTYDLQRIMDTYGDENLTAGQVCMCAHKDP